MQLDLIAPPPLPVPRLSDYDAVIVGSSGGKDSSVALAALVDEANRQRATVPVLVLHCDLGRVEWPGTIDLARRQAERYGLPFLTVKRNGLDLLDQVEHERQWWPDPGSRNCTSDHKTSQAARVCTAVSMHLLGRKHTRPGAYPLPLLPELYRGSVRGRPVRILMVLGMRAQESRERRGLHPLERGTKRYGAPSSTKVVDVWLPVHRWTEAEVWDRIHADGIEYHEAYDLGMPRLSCCFCIYAGHDALALAGLHNPELLAEYVRVERAIGKTFTTTVSLEDIQRDIQRGDIAPDIRPPSWAA